MSVDLKKVFLGSSLEELQSKWSKEDAALKEWLKETDRENLLTLLEMLFGFFNQDVCTVEFCKQISPRMRGGLDDQEVEVGASLIVHELREFGGVSMVSSRPYEKSIVAVHKRIASARKISIPAAASIRAREDHIATILFAEAWRDLNPSEVGSAIEGAEFKSGETFEKKKEIVAQTIASAGLGGVAKLLGKNHLKKAVLATFEHQTKKKIGEKATQKIVERAGERIAAESMKRAVIFVGWALLAKDIWDLMGEATRVTTPMISAISVMRSLDRQDESGRS